MSKKVEHDWKHFINITKSNYWKAYNKNQRLFRNDTVIHIFQIWKSSKMNESQRWLKISFLGVHIKYITLFCPLFWSVTRVTHKWRYPNFSFLTPSVPFPKQLCLRKLFHTPNFCYSSMSLLGEIFYGWLLGALLPFLSSVNDAK